MIFLTEAPFSEKMMLSVTVTLIVAQAAASVHHAKKNLYENVVFSNTLRLCGL